LPSTCNLGSRTKSGHAIKCDLPNEPKKRFVFNVQRFDCLSLLAKQVRRLFFGEHTNSEIVEPGSRDKPTVALDLVSRHIMELERSVDWYLYIVEHEL